MSYLSNRLDEQVVSILQNGGVGFMPSDTIYGLSCLSLNRQAVERVYRLKKRDSNKPLILLIATISQLNELGIDENKTQLAQEYWPGALTQICESTSPEWLHRGTHSLAVRMPDNHELRGLIAKTGPLVSTSANIQGDKAAVSVAEAKNYFSEDLDFYVDAGDLSNHQPSTLVRAIDGNLEVIRPGAVKVKEN